MTNTRYRGSEVAQRGQAWYDQNIRDKVEAEHKGKFLVVDVETGDYEIDMEDVAAIQRAKAKNPNAVLYMLRVGYRTAYTIGSQLHIERP